MAQILQQDSKVKEIYLTHAEIKDSKYLLFVYDNGSIVLKWCYEDIVEIQPNPILEKVGKKMILEYGEPNLFFFFYSLPFQDEQGNLDERWEKVI